MTITVNARKVKRRLINHLVEQQHRNENNNTKKMNTMLQTCRCGRVER